MKKLSILSTGLLLIFALCGTIYAAFVSGFVVVSITGDSVTIKNLKDNTEIVAKAKADEYEYHVGDKVKYDKKENKIQPEIEGC